MSEDAGGGSGAPEALLTEQGSTVTRDGLSLFWRGWIPLRPRAALLIVPGLAEHSGRYQETGTRLAVLGYACYALDYRGLGRSPGHRGHVDRFGHFLWDVHAVRTTLGRRHPGLPLFLLGHSQGGLLALLYALRHPELSGVVVCSPMLGLAPARGPLATGRRLLGRVLAVLAPRLRLPSGLDTSALSRDAAVVEAYRRDPLVSRKVSGGWYRAARAAMAEALASAPSLQVPALVMTAGQDRIVDPAAARRFAERTPAGRVEYVRWDGLYHELLNEPEKEQVRARMAAWLEARLDKRPVEPLRTR